MNFADLFKPTEKVGTKLEIQPSAPSAEPKNPFAEGAEVSTFKSNVTGKCVSYSGYSEHTCLCVSKDSEIQPSAPSAPDALVPLDVPFVEGTRYSVAGATDRNRLTLYRADPAGKWLRKHGVLIAFEGCAEAITHLLPAG